MRSPQKKAFGTISGNSVKGVVTEALSTSTYNTSRECLRNRDQKTGNCEEFSPTPKLSLTKLHTIG